MLICGGGQPICEVGWGRRNAPRPCDRCGWFTERVARAGRFRVLRLSDEFPWGPFSSRAPAEAEASECVTPADAPAASEAWFARSTEVDREPNGAAIKNDFQVSVSAVEAAFGRVLDRLQPNVVFALNGLFAAERAVRAVAADRGVRVITYELAPRKDALVFGEEGAAPEMLMDRLASDQLSRPLSPAEDNALDSLLHARMSGTGAHERYFDSQDHGTGAVRSSLGIAPSRRVISAFTNLAWDTALFGAEVAYESQFDWLARTAQTVGSRNDIVLVIRVHPAESRWGTAQPVDAELSKRLGALPDNIVLIGPDDPLSSYGLLEISDLVLCYTTTVGLEAAVSGIPVALAAKTHYRGRGFTTDIVSHAELAQAIADPPVMSSSQIELARRYAFAFFFRLMIPFTLVRNAKGWLAELPSSADDLHPGRDRYLDFVCERILEGGDLFLPSELALMG
jgi:hypothetical protein